MEKIKLNDLSEEAQVTIPQSEYLRMRKALKRENLFKRASRAFGFLLREIRGIDKVEKAIEEVNKRPIDAKISEDPDAKAQIKLTDEEDSS